MLLPRAAEEVPESSKGGGGASGGKDDPASGHPCGLFVRSAILLVPSPPPPLPAGEVAESVGARPEGVPLLPRAAAPPFRPGGATGCSNGWSAGRRRRPKRNPLKIAHRGTRPGRGDRSHGQHQASHAPDFPYLVTPRSNNPRLQRAPSVRGARPAASRFRAHPPIHAASESSKPRIPAPIASMPRRRPPKPASPPLNLLQQVCPLIGQAFTPGTSPLPTSPRRFNGVPPSA